MPMNFIANTVNQDEIRAILKSIIDSPLALVHKISVLGPMHAPVVTLEIRDADTSLFQALLTIMYPSGAIAAPPVATRPDKRGEPAATDIERTKRNITDAQEFIGDAIRSIRQYEIGPDHLPRHSTIACMKFTKDPAKVDYCYWCGWHTSKHPA
jgi:hypothetical protein